MPNFYRLTSERPPEVMAEFMRELERTIREASALRRVFAVLALLHHTCLRAINQR